MHGDEHQHPKGQLERLEEGDQLGRPRLLEGKKEKKINNNEEEAREIEVLFCLRLAPQG